MMLSFYTLLLCCSAIAGNPFPNHGQSANPMYQELSQAKEQITELEKNLKVMKMWVNQNRQYLHDLRLKNQELRDRNEAVVRYLAKSRPKMMTNVSPGNHQDPEGDDDQDEPQEEEKSLKLDDVLVKKGGVKWEDVVGLEDAKQALRGFAEIPLQLPHLFKGFNALTPWKGILLYGPPGTGKTYLAKAMVNTNEDVNFMSVSAADIMDKYVGESVKKTKDLFTYARLYSPAVLFIDEIDLLGARRTSGASGAGDSVKREVMTEFLTQMDGVKEMSEGLVVVGATNRPWDIDDAMLSRFQKKIHVRLPTEEARLAILEMMIKDVYVTEELRENLIQVAQKAELYSARDLKSLVQEARQMTLSDLRAAQWFKKVSPNPVNPELPHALVPMVPDYEAKEGEEMVETPFTELKDDPEQSKFLILPPMDLHHMMDSFSRMAVGPSKKDMKKLDKFEKNAG